MSNLREEKFTKITFHVKETEVVWHFLCALIVAIYLSISRRQHGEIATL